MTYPIRSKQALDILQTVHENSYRGWPNTASMLADRQDPGSVLAALALVHDGYVDLAGVFDDPSAQLSEGGESLRWWLIREQAEGVLPVVDTPAATS